MGGRFLGSASSKDTDSRLHSEAICLFGRQVVEQAKQVSIEGMAIEAELVAEGARQLRQQTGNPERQRAIIEAMDEETALALCRWIIEPQCMAAFIAKGSH
jgi:hypothetical protein